MGETLTISKKTFYRTIIFLLFLTWLFWPISSPEQNSDTNQNGIVLQQALPKDNFPNTKEFHWSHMPLTYDYNEKCENFSIMSEEGKGRYVVKIEKATQYITDKTYGAISFRKVESEPDIMFYCDFSHNAKYLTGLSSDTLAYEQSYIYEDTLLYSSSEIHFVDSGGCPANEIPVDVIHEIGHALGLEHNEGLSIIWNIMNSYEQDCGKAKFLKTDLDYLLEIYDQKGLYRPWGNDSFNCMQANYYSCFDFETQAEAQKVLDFCGVEKDMHNLDPDSDGKACENLP